MTVEIEIRGPIMTFDEVVRIQEFFNINNLTTKACEETGLEYHSVRRNLMGKSKDVKLTYAVILGEWSRMWERQEAERKALADEVPK